ncbi:laccase, multicopper oxidase, benzenediol:oxygen oxidorectuctase [Ceratobasidium sp. 423]|nr:laccase, multicopper oxidase, benzenediol:oxygen oxidorectuctase [Ceratobasidium sp. 423]
MVYPRDPHRRLYDVDDKKTVLIIGDWYHTSSKTILASGNITLKRPDSATINGKGRFDPDNAPANPDTLYTLKVKRGKSYRLRVINSSAIASFRMSIQGHKMTVEASQVPTYWINAPLTNVANKTAQALLVYGGDPRPYYPLKCPRRKWGISEAIIKYWKHKYGHGLLSGHGGLKARMLEGSLHLHGRRGIAKRQNENTTVVVDETKLVPLERPGATRGSNPADLVPNLTFGVNFTTGHWMINGIPYKSPDMPALLKILTDKDGVAESDFTPPHTVILPKNKCVEFNIKGNSGLGILHSIHPHGHTFDVVQIGNNPPNYTNPPRTDVVGATDEGVRIQFKTDNPGPWFLHWYVEFPLMLHGLF